MDIKTQTVEDDFLDQVCEWLAAQDLHHTPSTCGSSPSHVSTLALLMNSQGLQINPNKAPSSLDWLYDVPSPRTLSDVNQAHEHPSQDQRTKQVYKSKAEFQQIWKKQFQRSRFHEQEPHVYKRRQSFPREFSAEEESVSEEFLSCSSRESCYQADSQERPTQSYQAHPPFTQYTTSHASNIGRVASVYQTSQRRDLRAESSVDTYQQPSSEPLPDLVCQSKQDQRGEATMHRQQKLVNLIDNPSAVWQHVALGANLSGKHVVALVANADVIGFQERGLDEWFGGREELSNFQVFQVPHVEFGPQL